MAQRLGVMAQWLAEVKELILPPALYVASSGYDGYDFPEFWQKETDILSKDEWNLEELERKTLQKIQLLICYIYPYPSIFNGLQAYPSFPGHGAKANDTSLLVWNSDPGPWP